jgi:hypothetical protein
MPAIRCVAFGPDRCDDPKGLFRDADPRRAAAFAGIPEAQRALVRRERMFEPSPENPGAYEAANDRWVELYRKIEDLQERLPRGSPQARCPTLPASASAVSPGRPFRVGAPLTCLPDKH